MRAQREGALSERKRALLARLRERSRTAADRQSVTPLRDGDGGLGDVVLVHPVGGELLCYGELVRLLPSGYHVFGLAADDALRGDPPHSFVALAEHYVRRVERAGLVPVAVVGWSFGGMMAFEMVRLLRAAGHSTAAVAIDALPVPTRVPVRRLSDVDLMSAFAGDLARSAGALPEQWGLGPSTWELPRADVLDCVLGAMRTHGRDAGMNESDLDDRARVHHNAFIALDAHRPLPGSTEVHLVWATATISDPTGLWSEVTGGRVRARQVEADHYTILRPPAVAEVGAFVSGVLADQRRTTSAGSR